MNGMMTKERDVYGEVLQSDMRSGPSIKVEKFLSKQELQEIGIIHPSMEDQKAVSTFRNLRTALLNKMEQYNSCVLVSAVVSGGGASFTAANLAASFTFDHQKTAMLIDCNFKKPALAERFKINETVGLKDYLAGEVADVSEIVYPTGLPRFKLIPAGQGEDSLVEFFTGERMYSFLNEVRSRYSNRIIIIDAPPILESADAKILADLADYALLVVPYKGATPTLINKTLASIDKNKVVGMVLNN
jgi:protein-tyrosine kinase